LDGTPRGTYTTSRLRSLSPTTSVRRAAVAMAAEAAPGASGAAVALKGGAATGEPVLAAARPSSAAGLLVMVRVVCIC
jgi:hypothetical protein